VVKCFPGRYEALGLIPSTAKKKNILASKKHSSLKGTKAPEN
jgi:hypothetical protein